MSKTVEGIEISSLLLAASSFKDALGQVTSELTRDGAIQRFEYTFELCWKTMKRLLRQKGSEVNHPRDVFRESAAEGMIDDPAAWFRYLEKRNKTTHIYKREVAVEVFEVLAAFEKDLDAFLAYLRAKIEP